MAGKPTPDQFTLGMQVDIVEREIRYRETVYPRQVGLKKMSQENADLQLAGMKAVLMTLQKLRGVS